jgi:hypothetical protein
VCKIPKFDPTTLPYWDIYIKENKASTIQVGGTMAGEYTSGLSGGQRKLLLFELIFQRTMLQNDLLLIFDEPFAGVTDDFVPWIIERLNELRKKHNILIVTNDHVETLKNLADNTIIVSAIDRTKVQVNNCPNVCREKTILALSVGGEYKYDYTSLHDYKFFIDVEVRNNRGLVNVIAFSLFLFGLSIPAFWNSGSEQAPLVFVGTSLITYFCVNPYLITLIDWRNYMSEEAEALLHSSKSINKAMKSVVTLSLFLFLSFLEFGCSNAVLDGFSSIRFWVAMLLDSSSMTSPLLYLGLYTKLPFEVVQLLGFMPYLFMIFFSTTYSPGSGVGIVKELRYIFVRFYFYCMIPSLEGVMEGCPADNVIMLYMVLSSFFFVTLFLAYKAMKYFIKLGKVKETVDYRNKMKDDEFRDLQVELFGEYVISKDSSHRGTHSASTFGSASRHIPYGDVGDEAVVQSNSTKESQDVTLDVVA